jgi:queuine tRNA-ribosyltransferase
LSSPSAVFAHRRGSLAGGHIHKPLDLRSDVNYIRRTMKFECTGQAAGARRGTITTAHGVVETPAFMPVATLGTVKALAPQQLESTGTQGILANAYHLHLRPGEEIVEAAGGLHRFMQWEHPILTDSGGFQVFSLATLVKLEEEGVRFRSHIDGSECLIGPREAAGIQRRLGADMVTCFDQCTSYPCSREEAAEAVERTLRWARVCRGEVEDGRQAMFGIVQGSTYADLRAECCQRLVEMDFPGYAVGGLSVGEPDDMKFETLEQTLGHLPADRPRYLMGVGTPRDIVEAVRLGVDMFDCVMPTRNARNASLFTREGQLRILQERFKEDHGPVDPGCRCYLCANFSRAYLRHLFVSRELLAYTLATLHNVTYYQDLMRALRAWIDGGQGGFGFGGLE